MYLAFLLNVQFRWMYSQERELKKLRYTVQNKVRGDGCIAEAFTCKEITNFSSMYFLRANNVNAPTIRYHVVRDVLLSEPINMSPHFLVKDKKLREPTHSRKYLSFSSIMHIFVRFLGCLGA
jgi:hypothetical protein